MLYVEFGKRIEEETAYEFLEEVFGEFIGLSKNDLFMRVLTKYGMFDINFKAGVVQGVMKCPVHGTEMVYDGDGRWFCKWCMDDEGKIDRELWKRTGMDVAGLVGMLKLGKGLVDVFEIYGSEWLISMRLVCKACNELVGKEFKADDLMEVLGKNKTTTYVYLNYMLSRGLIERAGRGVYRVREVM